MVFANAYRPYPTHKRRKAAIDVSLKPSGSALSANDPNITKITVQNSCLKPLYSSSRRNTASISRSAWSMSRMAPSSLKRL